MHHRIIKDLQCSFSLLFCALSFREITASINKKMNTVKDDWFTVMLGGLGGVEDIGVQGCSLSYMELWMVDNVFPSDEHLSFKNCI